MPKEEWGVKRICPTTGKRFFDLNKSPVISPYTGEIVPIDVPGRKGSSAAPAEAVKAKPKVVKDLETDDDVLLDDDDDVTVEADDDLLEDEDDDTVSFDELGDVADSDDDS
ncbi:TIGR02300 family protein [Pararhodobacter zhoushanensis]|uniref:TIGR02300 family protein n=1 Tax=Pararhodobacter zhoushanensis TaxID=2479545 RepID=A0ABT3GT89_9RHOB|nr:TIGR02300 family protein [Pararhodobacter zhoushanensis]MCW1930764.1 TIGR02300 family protein [Pararhodobacter zhoushanensis]